MGAAAAATVGVDDGTGSDIAANAGDADAARTKEADSTTVHTIASVDESRNNPEYYSVWMLGEPKVRVHLRNFVILYRCCCCCCCGGGGGAMFRTLCVCERVCMWVCVF